MNLLLALAPLVWMALAQISTVKYKLYQIGMMVMDPLAQLQLPSSVSCALYCDMNSTCFTFSVTMTAGSVTCRMTGWKPKLIADPESEYFVGEIPQTYLPVPTTTRYIKMVYEPWLQQKDPTYQIKTWNQSLAACKVDGGWLAIDNDDTIHEFLYTLLVANGLYPGYICLWIGGYSTIDKWHWELLDGTQINLTGTGQARFPPGHPDQAGGGLQFYATVAPYCCGLWTDLEYFKTHSPGGYFCEIMLP